VTIIAIPISQSGRAGFESPDSPRGRAKSDGDGMLTTRLVLLKALDQKPAACLTNG